MLPKGPKIPFDHEPTLDFSVVVPVHRKRKGLKQCLESVLQQLRPGMELVIADHSGQMFAIGIKNEFEEPIDAMTRPPIQYKPVEPAGNMAGDWNRAVALCKGRWVHLLHDDDWVDQRFYESLHSEPPSVYGIQATGYRNVEVFGFTDKEDALKITFERPKYELPLWPGLAMSNQFQPSAVVVARKTYEDFGGYINMPHCPDWEFYARVSEAGVKWYLHNEILCNHREGTGENESAAPWAEQIHGYRRLLEYFYVHGVQRDALAAGANIMLSAAMKRCITAAADTPETADLCDLNKFKDVYDLLNLTTELERQRRRYLA